MSIDNIESLFLEHGFLFIENHVDVENVEIYHYSSPRGFMGIFNSKNSPKLWFTRYDCLNDKTESKDIMCFLEGYCNYKLKQGLFSQEFIDAVLNIKPSNMFFITTKGQGTVELEKNGIINDWTNISIAECDTYVCCFSEENDLLQMWNYYSKSSKYQGYCIGVYSEPFQNRNSFEKGYNISLKKVLYSNKEKTELFDKIFPKCEKIYNISNEEDKKRIIAFISDFINQYQFIFKNNCFSHEKEVRAILNVPKNKIGDNELPFEVLYRESNGYIVPYIEFLLKKK